MKAFIVSALAGIAAAAPVVETIIEYNTDCSTTASPTGTDTPIPSGSNTPSSSASLSPNPSGSTLPNPFYSPVPITPATDLATIEQQAHGTIPNIALPSSISDSSAVIWSLIAANEQFEVEYFTYVYTVLVNQIPGFDDVPNYKQTVDAIVAIRAQEQLHALAANAVLSTAGRPTMERCSYIFPPTSFEQAAGIARIFTDVVLGTLGSANEAFGTNGDSEFLRILASVIGNEGEQVGWFRSLLGVVPSALPFLTGGAATFAWSALNQLFIVPNSCPSVVTNAIQIPILPKLFIDSTVDSSSTSVNFSVENAPADLNLASIVYINQQNTPIVEVISNVQTQGNTTTFTAAFPYSSYLMNSLTIAAVTTTSGPFASADEVAASAIYGPGIIEIN